MYLHGQMKHVDAINTAQQCGVSVIVRTVRRKAALSPFSILRSFGNNCSVKPHRLSCQTTELEMLASRNIHSAAGSRVAAVRGQHAILAGIRAQEPDRLIWHARAVNRLRFVQLALGGAP